MKRQCGHLHTRKVHRDGKSVVMEVEQTPRGDWLLRVAGENGQISEWLQPFPSPFEALHAGLAAIDQEGIDGFHADPVFHYLSAASRALMTDT